MIQRWFHIYATPDGLEEEYNAVHMGCLLHSANEVKLVEHTKKFVDKNIWDNLKAIQWDYTMKDVTRI
eukprot:15346459-Ditylum_brightwellii.AAC.1